MMNSISRSIVIEPRNEHFHFEGAERRDWHGGDPVKSIIFNALSVQFPEGEKFFMDSVRNVRDQIDDPVLHAQIKGFLVQEAMHTREHVDYNRQLDAQGFRATELHLKLRDQLNFARNLFGRRRQLAVTCALEHFTAIIADLLMSDPAFLEGADERYKKIWLWHSLEEAEHKGVAYDAFQTVTEGKGYALRCLTMLTVAIHFNHTILKHVGTMLADVGLSRSPRAWGKVFWFLMGRPGFYRRMFPSWLEYFKPSFHPWDDDNRALIAEVETQLLGSSPKYEEHLEQSAAA